MANPFSTRFTRPGAIPFRRNETLPVGSLLSTLEGSRWMGQIVGPHGCGKSTLALELAKHVDGEFTQLRHLTVRKKGFSFQLVQLQGLDLQTVNIDRETHSLFLKDSDSTKTPRTFFVFDGWQRISRLNRYLFIKNCERFNHGLLVTSHRKTAGLSCLADIQPDRKVFFQLIRYLQRDSFFELDGSIAERAFADANGNFREAFMRLYDEFEREKDSKLSKKDLFMNPSLMGAASQQLKQ